MKLAQVRRVIGGTKIVVMRNDQHLHLKDIRRLYVCIPITVSFTPF